MGNDISAGHTYSTSPTGRQVTAENLNALCGDAEIKETFLSLKPLKSVPALSDQLLITDGGYKRITLQSMWDVFLGALVVGSALISDGSVTNLKIAPAAIFASHANGDLIHGQTVKASPEGTDEIILFDPSTGLLRKSLINTLPSNLGVGSVIGSAITNITATSTITADIPYDNSIPQISEGTEVATVVVTPPTTGDKVRIRARFNCQGSANSVFVIALFRNSTANALAAARAYVDGTLIGGVTLEFEDSPASTSAQTYRLRAGTSAGTLYINQTQSGQVFNGVGNDVTLVAEIIKG